METDVGYNLDLIEFKIKEKYERSMQWLNCLRQALKKDTGTEQDVKWIKTCEQYVGAELACSIQGTDRLDDPDDIPRYCYSKDGGCGFDIKGVHFMVADLRDMRKDPTINEARFYDICCVICDYHHDEDDPGITQYEFVPEAWLYGSTGSEFDEYKPVHDFFIKKCTEFIETHGGADKLRKAQEDEDECKENGE